MINKEHAPMPPSFIQCLRRSALLLIAALGALTLGPVAVANDRPFQVARTAILEDDAQTWSFESWLQRFGSVRGVSVEPEYTFGGGTSVQVELARYVDRDGAQTGQSGEIEFKQVFNDIARDGWGWGVSAALGAQRSGDDGTVRSIGLKLPVSISLGAGGGYLHLNPGIDKVSGSRRSWSASAAIEREIVERAVGFAEYAHEGEERYGQVGVRYWLRREKLAIDFAWQEQRREGRRGSGFIVGLGVYDF
jgi:hypothetical protein